MDTNDKFVTLVRNAHSTNISARRDDVLTRKILEDMMRTLAPEPPLYLRFDPRALGWAHLHVEKGAIQPAGDLTVARQSYWHLYRMPVAIAWAELGVGISCPFKFVMRALRYIEDPMEPFTVEFKLEWRGLPVNVYDQGGQLDKSVNGWFDWRSPEAALVHQLQVQRLKDPEGFQRSFEKAVAAQRGIPAP